MKVELYVGEGGGEYLNSLVQNWETRASYKAHISDGTDRLDVKICGFPYKGDDYEAYGHHISYWRGRVEQRNISGFEFCYNDSAV